MKCGLLIMPGSAPSNPRHARNETMSDPAKIDPDLLALRRGCEGAPHRVEL